MSGIYLKVQEIVAEGEEPRVLRGSRGRHPPHLVVYQTKTEIHPDKPPSRTELGWWANDMWNHVVGRDFTCNFVQMDNLNSGTVELHLVPDHGDEHTTDIRTYIAEAFVGEPRIMSCYVDIGWPHFTTREAAALQVPFIEQQLPIRLQVVGVYIE